MACLGFIPPLCLQAETWPTLLGEALCKQNTTAQRPGAAEGHDRSTARSQEAFLPQTEAESRWLSAGPEKHCSLGQEGKVFQP